MPNQSFNNSEGFRTKVFGGFNKKDVFNCFNQVSADFQEQIYSLNQQSLEKDGEIKALKSEQAEKDERINELTAAVKDFEAQINELISENNALKQDIARLSEAQSEQLQAAKAQSEPEEITQRVLQAKIDSLEKDSQILKMQVEKLTALNLEYSAYKNYYDDATARVERAESKADGCQVETVRYIEKSKRVQSVMSRITDDDFEFIKSRLKSISQVSEMLDMLDNIRTKVNNAKQELNG